VDLISVVVGILTWLVGWIGRRMTLLATFTTLVATMYATFLGVVVAATAGISATIPDWVSQALAMFLPSQAGAAMAVVMTARAARWVYDTSRRVAEIAILLH